MHARRAILPIVLCAAFAYTECARRPAVRTPAEDDMPVAHGLTVADAPRTIDELRARIADVLARDELPGVGIALVGRDGPIWVGGVGMRDLAAGAPMEADTVFRVGSLSKTVVALGVMRLVDQGKLDVDRPLRELVPDVVIDNPWEDVAPVTLAQCLEHTAGFDEVRFNEVFAGDERISVRDALAINPRSKRVRWRPGTRHSYSNVGYSIAARAIEVATGEPFDAYLKREILAPLGITDADFGRTDALVARLATGYLDADTPAAFHPFVHRASGALLASASDLAKILQFLIRRGDGFPPIVSKAGLARIERSGTLPYPHMDAEYGFANYADVAHPVYSRGHDGGAPGFHAAYRYFPSLGVGYAMLLNSNYEFRGYREIRSLLYGYLTRDRTDVPAPPPAAPAGNDQPGAGFFAFANPRNELFGFIDTVLVGWSVTGGPDGLHVDELMGESYSLVPTADGGYRHPEDCGSSVRFLTTADGTHVMLMGFFAYAEAMPGWAARLRFFALMATLYLLHAAPLFAGLVLAFSALSRRRIVPTSLLVWPAIAGLCCRAVPLLLDASFDAGVVGVVHPLTVAFCAVTILLAVAAAASLVGVLRWSLRPDRPHAVWLLVPAACAIGASGLVLWLGAHGWIGLRMWAW